MAATPSDSSLVRGGMEIAAWVCDPVLWERFVRDQRARQDIAAEKGGVIFGDTSRLYRDDTHQLARALFVADAPSWILLEWTTVARHGGWEPWGERPQQETAAGPEDPAAV